MPPRPARGLVDTPELIRPPSDGATRPRPPGSRPSGVPVGRFGPACRPRPGEHAVPPAAGDGARRLPVIAFATAVQLGIERNDSTVRTVGSEATRGIAYAQALKVDLADLDEVVVRSLLDGAPLEANGLPGDYNAKRAEVHDSLVLAALVSSSGAAYEQPLANIDYVLSHYHALVKDAFAAMLADDTAGAVEAYGQAHQVMAETLLPEADFVDKANSYVLNDSYDTQNARSASTARLIVVSWLALLAFLVLAQVLVERRFRRVVNLGLALATVVALASGVFTLNRLATRRPTSPGRVSRPSTRCTCWPARHRRVGPAGAGPVPARSGGGDGARAAFQDQVQRLLRVQGSDVADLAQTGTVPAGAGGYLARVAGPEATSSDPESVRRAVVAFGAFLTEDAAMGDLVSAGDTEAATATYTSGRAYAELDAAIDARRPSSRRASTRRPGPLRMPPGFSTRSTSCPPPASSCSPCSACSSGSGSIGHEPHDRARPAGAGRAGALATGATAVAGCSGRVVRLASAQRDPRPRREHAGHRG